GRRTLYEQSPKRTRAERVWCGVGAALRGVGVSVGYETVDGTRCSRVSRNATQRNAPSPVLFRLWYEDAQAEHFTHPAIHHRATQASQVKPT
ncbi:hypothetical protein CPAR01_13773, partial [Colletotrichum paranaense]